MLQSCTMPLACSVGCAAGCAAACSPGRFVIRDWPLELQPKRPSTQRKHNRQRGCGKGFSHDGSPIDSVQYSIRPMATLQMVVLSDGTPESTAASSQDALNVITIYTTLHYYVSYHPQIEELQGVERLAKPNPPLGAAGLDWYKVRLDAREQKNTNAQCTRPIAWPKAEVKPPPFHWMNASRGSRRMAESIEKTQALDDLAQFAAAIDGVLEVGSVDSLPSQPRVRNSSQRALCTFQGNQAVTIGERLRALRKEKKLSQRDIAKKTGLLRCNLWRLEIGRQVPTIETLEKMARALGIPMYQLFFVREGPPRAIESSETKVCKGQPWGQFRERRIFARRVLSPVWPHERK